MSTPENTSLSLHDALPIFGSSQRHTVAHSLQTINLRACFGSDAALLGGPQRREPSCLREREGTPRSEEHTSELQSPCNLVCRLLLEKIKSTANTIES